MIRTCNRCGYQTEPVAHWKHLQSCVPKSQWPAEYQQTRSSMPSVTVKVVDAQGSHDIPVVAAVSAPAAVVAPDPPAVPPDVVAPDDTETARDLSHLKQDDQLRLAPGACCTHPQEVHIADAEGFPPTCMSCPDGADEHSWEPKMVDEIVTTFSFTIPNADESRTINSPLNLVCDCGFLARNAQSLRVHRQRAKQHHMVTV